VVTPRTRPTNQLPGRGVCSQIIYEGTVQYSHTPEDGQPDSCFLRKQDGRHPLSSSELSSLSGVAVVSPQGNNDLSRIPPRYPEQGGR